MSAQGLRLTQVTVKPVRSGKTEEKIGQTSHLKKRDVFCILITTSGESPCRKRKRTGAVYRLHRQRRKRRCFEDKGRFGSRKGSSPTSKGISCTSKGMSRTSKGMFSTSKGMLCNSKGIFCNSKRMSHPSKGMTGISKGIYRQQVGKPPENPKKARKGDKNG